MTATEEALDRKLLLSFLKDPLGKEYCLSNDILRKALTHSRESKPHDLITSQRPHLRIPSHGLFYLRRDEKSKLAVCNLGEALTRTRPFRNPGLKTFGLHNAERYASAVSKPQGLWCFVAAAQAKTHEQQQNVSRQILQSDQGGYLWKVIITGDYPFVFVLICIL